MDLIIGQILPYTAAVVFIGGVTWRIWRWMIPRIVHNITLSPWPASWSAAIVWILWQFATFWNLLKFDRPLWAGAWFMHIALFLMLGGHIAAIYTVGLQFHLMAPGIITPEMSLALSVWIGTVLGLIFLAALLYLLGRRLVNEQVRNISSASDFLHLFLLIGIAALGNIMRLFPDYRLGYAPVREYLAGLFLFNPQPLPDHTLFIMKYTLVMTLMIVFPFSKLMHSFGFFWERWIVNRPYKEPARGLPGARLQLRK
jgi:nitrate reductase gamma subunit